MAVCAETLTPMIAECGGKDAVIVAEDADLDKAAEATAFGTVLNAGGQACVGVERIYVAAPVYQQFVDKLTAALSRARPGPEDTATYGPMTLPRQVDIVRRHILDALDHGATAVMGGLDSVRDRYIEPVVLKDVPIPPQQFRRRPSVRRQSSSRYVTSTTPSNEPTARTMAWVRRCSAATRRRDCRRHDESAAARFP